MAKYPDFELKIYWHSGTAEYFDGYWHNEFKMPKKALEEIISVVKKYEKGAKKEEADE